MYRSCPAAAVAAAGTLPVFAARCGGNTLTYRDKRLKGRGPVLLGFASFYAVCSIAVTNGGIANFLFMEQRFT